jgi:type IV pilus assembly protein PilW
MKNTVFSRQQGFTLVEMMVSILISTIMIGVALTQLLGSRTLFALHEADARIGENARYALEVLSKNIRMASFVDINDGSQQRVTAQFYNGVCDATNFSPCTADGATTNSDHFAIWYNPDNSNEVTCSGIALSNAAGLTSVANVYYIGADANTAINGLRCRSYSIGADNTASLIAGSDQVIIEGIDNMQVLYGVTDGEFDSITPQRYISADTVNAIAANPALKDKWARVVAAKVALLVGTGFNDGTDQATSRNYQLADAPTITRNDGNRRKIFSATVAINNANL